MNNIINLLLRASISASLSDREAFVDRVAKIIEDQMGKDPEAAHKIGDNIAAAMDGMNEQMLLQQLLRPQANDDLNKKIDALTTSIDKLTAAIERLSPETSNTPKEK